MQIRLVLPRAAVLGAILVGNAAAAANGQDIGIEVPATVAVSAGYFIAGSDRAEREAAYRLDEAAYGHRRRMGEGRWYG